MRLVAPESPGVAFFATPGNMKDRPVTVRALILNLGQADATDVIVRVRNPGEGGAIFAKGIADVPARSVGIAVLPAIAQWKGWTGQGKMEVAAPGGQALIFNYARYR